MRPINRSEQDSSRYEALPPTDAERSLEAVADWGPAGGLDRCAGEIWFAATPGGDRPVLVLTRDPVAERVGSVVVAALTKTKRHLVSELDLTAAQDGLPTDCVVNFDNLHTLPRDAFRHRIATVPPARLSQAGLTLRDALGC